MCAAGDGVAVERYRNCLAETGAAPGVSGNRVGVGRNWTGGADRAGADVDRATSTGDERNRCGCRDRNRSAVPDERTDSDGGTG